MTRTVLLASAAACAAFALSPIGAAQAQTAFDWSGFYAGVHGGLLKGDVNIIDEGKTASGNLSGPIVGVLAGYNFPMSPFAPAMVGVEADFGFGDLHGTGTDTIPEGDVFTYFFDWDAHTRVRLGMPQGMIMPFVAAGLAFAQLHISEGGRRLDVGGLYTGVTLGGGLDVKLAPNMIGRMEGLYDQYHRKTFDDYSVDFSAWTIRAAFILRFP